MMNLSMQVPSQTSQAVYTVTRHVSTGAWSCTCPSWRFQRGRNGESRSCKHLTGLALDLAGHVADRAGVRV